MNWGQCAPTEDSKLLQLRCCWIFQRSNDYLQEEKMGILLFPLWTTNQFSQSTNVQINLRLDRKGTPFFFLSQQFTSNVIQQMCQSTTLWHNTKRTPFSFLFWQSTSSIHQQMHRLTTSWLDTKKTSFSFLSQLNQPVMSINNCVDWPHLDSKGNRFLSHSSCNNPLIMTINKCVDWLLCNSIQRRLLSPTSHDNQSVQSTNKCVNQQHLYLVQMELVSPSCHNINLVSMFCWCICHHDGVGAAIKVVMVIMTAGGMPMGDAHSLSTG